MSESLGRRLRRERERRDISLSAIAAETKIARALLEALERDDLTRWPPGIFRRSFVRAYADAIGVDAEAVVDEFLTRFPEASVAEAARTPSVDHLLTVAPLRLTLADDSSLLSGFSLASKIRRSWKAVVWDLAVLLAIAACGFVVHGEFWMVLAVASLIYYAGGVLMLGNTPGVILFEPKAASQEPSHLRLLVGNAAPPEDEVQDLILNLGAREETAEPTRRAVG
jgi:transcriptional regulator with XRE-family HTH domain